MAIQTNRDAAMAELVRDSAPSIDPALAASELEDILDSPNVKVASIWVASTPYVYGDIIMPILANGHRYRCIVSGTSGTTEPTWPLSQFWKVEEGTSTPNKLTWEEDGRQLRSLWDMRRAKYEAWKLKYTKATDRYRFETDTASYQEQQVLEFIEKMVNRYAPLSII